MKQHRQNGVLFLAFALVAAVAVPLFGQRFIDYTGMNAPQAVKSLIVCGTTQGCTGPELTRSSSTVFALPGLAVTNAITAGTLSVTGATTTSDGVGAKTGATVTVSERGDGAAHKTILTLASTPITMTDAGAAGSHGSTLLYTFPEGVIVRGGCVANTTTLAGAGGITDTAAVVLALGSAATATDNATLAGAGEADYVASFAGTLTDGAGSFKKYGEPSVTSLDGHTTAIVLRLNAAVPDADSSASDTLAVTGAITCVWHQTGDFT